MRQVIDGKVMYVVEFDTIPELPITGLTEEEMEYENIVTKIVGNLNGLLYGRVTRTSLYARALQLAIETGVISEPGKYGIHLYKTPRHLNGWNVYKIIE